MAIGTFEAAWLLEQHGEVVERGFYEHYGKFDSYELIWRKQNEDFLLNIPPLAMMHNDQSFADSDFHKASPLSLGVLFVFD